MKPIFIDAIILIILFFSAWRGAGKGMIMTLSGLAILICALVFSGHLADRISPYVQTFIDPYVSEFADDTISTAVQDDSVDEQDEEHTKETAANAFSALGIWEKTAAEMGDKISGDAKIIENGIKKAISDMFSNSVAYILSRIISFLAIIIIASIIIGALDLTFKLPGLHLLNKLGGLVLGLVYGLLIVFAAAWVLKYSGMLIGQETVENTMLLKLFMNFNPLPTVFPV